MFKKPLIRAATALGLCAMPAVAEAAPLVVTVPSAMPLTAIGASQVNCPARPAMRSPFVAPVQIASGMSKSAAILGGQPSALERMRMQQNAGGTPAVPAGAASLAPALPAASGAVPLAAMGFSCISREDRAATGSVPGIAIPRRETVAQPSGGRFLGTERVKIGRTRFDAEWKRVSSRTLSQHDLTSAIGAIPADREELLGEVNAWVNRSIRYKSDRRDSWADAASTLASRAGDCEDYAILKMQLLGAAGVSPDDMMLTLARDTMRRLDHAVLLVRNGGEWVMLDMQSDRIAPAAMDYGYRPVMSFAGGESFLHGRKYVAPEAAQPRRLALAN